MDKANFRELFSESEIKAKDTESGIDILVYRLTGLTPEQIRELKERDTAKVPQLEGDGYANGEMVYDEWICPNCGEHYEVDYDDYDFCPNCGQRILRQEE